MSHRHFLAVVVLTTGVAAAQPQDFAPDVLPSLAAAKLAESLEATRVHAKHVWRDTPQTDADGTVNAYIEISKGDRRKRELDMRANARAIDRVMPENVGGYPVNYGFVSQTVSYDGDPFDALVLGPPITGGETVRGIVVGLMYMEDGKGLDSKVVLSMPRPDGRPTHELPPSEQRRIAEYFRRYKEHQPGAYSRVPGAHIRDTSMRSPMMKLDSDEKELLVPVEGGKCKSAKRGKRARARYSGYATATFRKDRRLNIRPSSKDLEAIQKRALAEGLPYQTLISSLLHEYASGRLKEI